MNKELTEALNFYHFHGVEITAPKKGRSEASAVCPFCGNDTGKFTINQDTGLYQCKAGSCGAEGNSTIFLRQFYELCLEETRKADYDELAEESGFVSGESAKLFGCALSTLRDQWLVPGFNQDRLQTGLYRFVEMKDEKTGKWKPILLTSPGTGLHLLNLQNYNPEKKIVDLCEGWRDAIAWQECLMLQGIEDRNVISITGTSSFKPQWCKLFENKIVNILFDNDHPRKQERSTELVEGAGSKATKTIASILVDHDKPPKEINCLYWGGDTDEQFSLDITNKTDIRSYLNDYDASEVSV